MGKIPEADRLLKTLEALDNAWEEKKPKESHIINHLQMFYSDIKLDPISFILTPEQKSRDKAWYAEELRERKEFDEDKDRQYHEAVARQGFKRSVEKKPSELWSNTKALFKSVYRMVRVAW